MVSGIRLTLLIGPAVPAAAPSWVAEALISARVTVSARGPSGFQLTFAVPRRSSWATVFLLSGGSTIPLLRVVLVATVSGRAEVISDGFMTHHELTPGSDGGPSTLTILGEDLTSVLDRVTLNGVPFPSMSFEARAAMILLKYAPLGIVPKVVPTVFPDVPNLAERIAQQRGTDLAYLRLMAAWSGYVFYIEPGPDGGRSVGYWGPEIKVGPVQPPLNVDMDALTNVDSISFRLNSNEAKLPVAFIRPAGVPVPIPVPIPDVSLVNPPLGLVPPGASRFPLLSETSKMSLPQALLFGLSQRAHSVECVTAEGSLNVVRYGRLLQARKLVGLRGSGRAFDGLYYVSRVTHEIEPGRYRQRFQLTRNALVSTVDKVPA